MKAKVRVQVKVKVRVQVKVKVRVQVKAKVRVQVKAKVRVQVKVKVRMQVKVKVRVQVRTESRSVSDLMTVQVRICQRFSQSSSPHQKWRPSQHGTLIEPQSVCQLWSVSTSEMETKSAWDTD